MAGLVRDNQPFFDARISFWEVMRFARIALDWLTAAQMACKAAVSNERFLRRNSIRSPRLNEIESYSTSAA
jgi:hypothetical protein